MINSVCVLTIKVDNIQAAIDFYTNVLDFNVSKYYGEKIVSLQHEAVPIVLEETEHQLLGNRQGVLLGLLSQDIEQDFSQLKAKGVKVLFDEPKPCPPGRYFVIEDPSRNEIELVQFL
ncbi:VOC family protein [Cytobacillus luteolus]|nr:VOC family protein [Cytobacillus luteolus]MBP1941089.1 putative enzyme related to lactoylglutathione lyase [Cytobacillus luteolus]